MLDKAIEMMGEGYLSNEEIADTLSRKYGRSPEEVLEEIDRRKSILKNIGVIIDVLTPQQAKILELTSVGLTQTQIAEEIHMSQPNVKKERDAISKRLFKVADERRIQTLRQEIKKRIEN